VSSVRYSAGGGNGEHTALRVHLSIQEGRERGQGHGERRTQRSTLHLSLEELIISLNRALRGMGELLPARGVRAHIQPGRRSAATSPEGDSLNVDWPPLLGALPVPGRNRAKLSPLLASLPTMARRIYPRRQQPFKLPKPYGSAVASRTSARWGRATATNASPSTPPSRGVLRTPVALGYDPSPSDPRLTDPGRGQTIVTGHDR
jgi:hypothetical protein